MILFTYFVVLSILLFNLCACAVPRNLVTDINRLNESTLKTTLEEDAPRTRIKRDGEGVGGGAGKYAAASRTSQIKALRLLLQMLSNFWIKSYVGGRNPFHPNVPKAIVFLFKDKIEQFFFPPAGGDPSRQVMT